MYIYKLASIFIHGYSTSSAIAVQHFSLFW
jgi:hypothetical protein